MPPWRRGPKKEKTAVIFPGQGSQKLGMVRILKSETQERLFREVEEVLKKDPRFCSRLKYLITLDTKGMPEEEMKALKEELDDTRFVQMAIWIVSCGWWDEFIKTAKKVPSHVLGLSLGEYAALYAARVFDFKVGTMLVYIRSQLMSIASVSSDGGMLVVRKDEKVKEKEIKKALKKTDIEFGNLLSPKRITLSGGMRDLRGVDLLLRRRGYMTSLLPVSGAFHHSKYMKGVEADMEEGFANLGLKLEKPKIPVILNYTGQTENDPGRIENALIKQLTNSVRFQASIELLIKEGISRKSILVASEDSSIISILRDFSFPVLRGSQK